MRLVFVTLMILAVGCNGAGETVPTDEDTVPSVDTEGDGNVLPPDTFEDTATDAVPEDTASELVGDLPAACEPGDGCFSDPCEDGGDCLSGLCVGHMGDQVCTVECLEDCPDGWTCRQLGTGPDVIFACISPYTHLCRPCETSDDCVSANGVEDACLVLGSQGSFCGAPCAGAGDCPEGFTCVDAATAEGGASKQCVPVSNICACSGTAMALGLSAACWEENDLGTCHGLRICGPEGLGACDAPEPADEICNGVDDDCDGETDEITCDDDNPCTEDSCEAGGGCVHVALTGVECTDGDVCSLADHCEDGTCVGTAINCDDGNPCTSDSCDPAGGCIYGYNSLTCDDGNPCTVGDMCAQGACAGITIDCDCQTDVDCLALEDGDVCNGTLHCNLDALPHECAITTGSVVECGEPSGDDAACLTAACDPLSGACSFVAGNEGGACDDGDLCTLGDHCDEGECLSGVAFLCDDGNPCTDDSCEPLSGCMNSPNVSPCNDGNTCTLGDHCVDGACLPESSLSCDDGNPCTNDTCDALGGCEHGFNTAACDDANACTVGEGCQGGVCVGVVAMPCNDGNLCTDDSCEPASGCVSSNNTAPCNDGNPCTTGDVCAAGVCAGAGTKNCDDGNLCTDDSCDADGGCVHAANTDACNDGNPCTTEDHCASGGCVGGGALECNDGNPCTDDSCSTAVGCVFAATDAPCSDGDACTLGDVCEDSACVSTGILSCDDGNPCTDETCDPQSGCSFTSNTEACDDGNACTEVDICGAGACVGTGISDCNDGNLCTDDSCDPAEGCVHGFNTVPCNDGDACTLGDSCADGACVAETLTCDDGNPCTDDGCDGDSGCVYTPNDTSCDDGNACTEVDACVAGTCVGSTAPDCNDGNLCTDDSCDPVTGCVHGLNTAPCDDGDVCTLGDACNLGACQGGGVSLPCNDGNLCTDDSCDPVSGCKFIPNSVGCTDGNACTTGDTCTGGVCAATGILDCDDGDICTNDLCDIGAGCLHPNNSAPCDDGNLCTIADACAAGTCQGGAPLNCADDNVCTDDVCSPQTGCVHTNNAANCDDNNVCTLGDACAAGECQPGGSITCNDGDDCTADTCNPQTGCAFTAITPCCGNGIPEAGEQCDDGNEIPGDGCENNCTNTSQKTYYYKYLGNASNAYGGSWGNKTCNAGTVGSEYVGYTSGGTLGPGSSPGPHNLYGPVSSYSGGSGFYKFRCVYE